jgi:nitroreductase
MTTDTHQTAQNVLETLLHERFSCRGFRPDQVDRPTITRMLELAQRSPSWCNTQPWQVAITDGDSTDQLRAAILAHLNAGGTPQSEIPFPERYTGIYQQRRRECAWQLYDSVGIEHGDRAASAVQTLRNFSFFDAPHVAIITTEPDLGTYGALDCGVYVANLLLAAQSLGIATIPQAALALVAAPIRAHLNLPEDRHVLCGISFGYADHDHPANGFRTHRADLDQVITWTPPEPPIDETPLRDTAETRRQPG